MSTAIVNAEGINNCNYQLRILLDSASEKNFITMTACKKLGLKLNNVHKFINELGNMTCIIKHSCQVQFKSRVSEFKINPYCFVVPKITKDLPSVSIKVSELPVPETIKLADPLFGDPSNIDALIGGEFFFDLQKTGKIEIGNELPILQNHLTR